MLWLSPRSNALQRLKLFIQVVFEERPNNIKHINRNEGERETFVHPHFINQQQADEDEDCAEEDDN